MKQSRPLYAYMLLNIMLSLTVPALHAAAHDTATSKEVKKEDMLTVASNNALIHSVFSTGVTKKNIDFIHQRLDAGASVHPCAKNGWNLLHYLAISEVENRTIFPLLQKVINKGMSGSGKDKNYKQRQTPEGKTAEQLAQTYADAGSPFKQMYHSRALFIRDFRTNQLTALALHRVLLLYNSNKTIAKDAQTEIAALQVENPEEYALIEPYLHDKPNAPCIITAKL
jgi:hypothetical protein